MTTSAVIARPLAVNEASSASTRKYGPAGRSSATDVAPTANEPTNGAGRVETAIVHVPVRLAKPVTVTAAATDRRPATPREATSSWPLIDVRLAVAAPAARFRLASAIDTARLSPIATRSNETPVRLTPANESVAFATLIPTDGVVSVVSTEIEALPTTRPKPGIVAPNV